MDLMTMQQEWPKILLSKRLILTLQLMVLVTHQMQNPMVYPSSSLAWSKGMKMNQHRTMLHMLSKYDVFMTSKHVFSIRLRAPRIRHNARAKPLKIFSFKGSAKNYESGDELSNSKPANNSVGTSYLPQDCEEPLTSSPKLQDVATHNLFTKWLTLLHMHPLGRVDGNMKGADQEVVLHDQNETHAKESGNLVKMVRLYFLGLDSTVKIPLLIFVPFYLVVNVVYGAEVSRELTPLWICGPLITALYVKLLQWILALYVFSFRQTVKILKDMPMYYQYVVAGKMKEDIGAHLWQPIVDIKNLDYKKVFMQKRKELGEWIEEKYLDYVESIWPFYCRTVRFLKRANFI